MPDEFSPDLGGLESDYRILTELRHSRRSRTYLARHLGLNRDVSILVLGVPGNEHDNSLTLFASDARTLSVIRHPNVVPVIEGRWLAGGTFAVVRPHVRGPLLDEVVAFEGPFAASRVASTLGQVSYAVAWARDNGIVHRGLSGDTVRFQQGSGRVLLEMEFSPLGTGGGVPDEYDDARTIANLAFQMLTGRRPDDDTGLPLAELRPDLPQRVVRELATAMSGDRRSSVSDPNVLIAHLAGVPDSSFVPRPPRRETPPRTTLEAPPSTKPSDTPGKGRMGFGARLVILAIVSTAIGAAGTLVYQREPSRPAPAAPTVAKAKVQASEGGEVARGKPQPQAKPQSQKPAPVAAPANTVQTKTPPPPLVEPPTTRRHEPLSGNPPAMFPSPVPAGKTDTSKPAATKSTAGVTSLIDVCESFDAADQRACLSISIDHGDKIMNAVFDRFIATLRRRASADSTAPDPETVVNLRQAQRDWLAARVTQCRTVGAAPLYASARARCYADAADKRTKDLREQADSLSR